METEPVSRKGPQCNPLFRTVSMRGSWNNGSSVHVRRGIPLSAQEREIPEDRRIKKPRRQLRGFPYLRYKKVRVGFEPTNNGFAIHRLRPLGYRTGIFRNRWIAVTNLMIGKTLSRPQGIPPRISQIAATGRNLFGKQMLQHITNAAP